MTPTDIAELQAEYNLINDFVQEYAPECMKAAQDHLQADQVFLENLKKWEQDNLLYTEDPKEEREVMRRQKEEEIAQLAKHEGGEVARNCEGE